MTITRHKVFVVDDDPAICKLVASVLQPHADVTAFANPRQLFDALTQAVPACILLDLKLGAASGVEILRDLRANEIHAPVIMVTAFASVPTVVETMKLGALDFLTKPFAPKDLVRKVTGALASAPAAAGPAGATFGLASLTAREREILQHVAVGHTSEEIAQTLGISLHTVNHHRANMMARTRAKNIPHLVRLAIEQQIIKAS